MRLVFLCGSLEPGRDGVGDYVRRLSAMLIKNGHTVMGIALKDRYIEKELRENQEAEGDEFKVIRIPFHYSDKTRISLASEFIEALDPEVISLQFVAYSFSKKGIPFGIVRLLKALTNKRKVNIMFHELWLDSPIGLSQQLVAPIQKFVIQSLVRSLKPQSVNVSIPFNKDRLMGIGIDSKMLPLFGNIYQSTQKGETYAKAEPQYPEILYFGGPPRGQFLDLMIDGLLEYLNMKRTGLKIVLVCGNSRSKDEFCQLLHDRLFGYDYHIKDCGFLEAGEISELMFSCDVGVVKSNAILLGKSGAAIAMLEHGLPLWMPKWDGIEPLSTHFRKELAFSDLAKALNAPMRPEYKPLLYDVSINFMKGLTE